MVNKKLVRLTESDLHRLIKESVNQILTELDWRTYYSAAQKSRLKAKDPKLSEPERNYHRTRMQKFDHAAREAFKEKFGTYDIEAFFKPANEKELQGQAEAGRHFRGGDEYINGKGYRKKIN